jgi:acetyl-CoA acetyltransferase
MTPGDVVTVAGVGMHPFGRFEGVSIAALGAHAARQALAECGIHPGDRDAVSAAFCATAYGGVATGHRVLGALAMTGMPIVDVEAGCASGAAALALGAVAVRSGEHDRVLVLGVEKMPKGMIRSSFFEPWQEVAGVTPAPAWFALRAQRLLRERGLGKDHLAAVVVKNRANGVANPDAMYREAVTAERVLASRVVCEPLHLWMLCSPNEGAAAVVLERGRGDVYLRAVSLRSHLPGSVLAESSPLAGIDDADIPSPTVLAAGDAFAAAGAGPTEVDAVECQDTDAARELLAWEELGLCAPGDQAAALADGRFGPGGPCPVNPSGGLLSKGEPLGASALGQVVSVVRRLRAGHGRLVLTHTIGRGANASVALLSR